MFAEDVTTMTLPKSVFKVAAELRDDGQQITYLNETKNENFAREKLTGVLSTIFLDSLSEKKLYPNFHNNVARFPGTVNAVFLTEDTSHTPITLELETNGHGSTTSPQSILICKLDSLFPLKAALQPAEDSVDSDHCSSISFAIVPSSTHSLYVTKFDVDTLQEGNYTIAVSLKDKSDKVRFSYLWLDKPFTLKNFPLALSLLKYIVTDSIFSYISSGNNEEQREKFNEYWKSRNPTPRRLSTSLNTNFTSGPITLMNILKQSPKIMELPPTGGKLTYFSGSLLKLSANFEVTALTKSGITRIRRRVSCLESKASAAISSSTKLRTYERYCNYNW